MFWRLIRNCDSEVKGCMVGIILPGEEGTRTLFSIFCHLNSAKFGQLILSKIVNSVATSY